LELSTLFIENSNQPPSTGAFNIKRVKEAGLNFLFHNGNMVLYKTTIKCQ
jgi:hypothetical protein